MKTKETSNEFDGQNGPNGMLPQATAAATTGQDDLAELRVSQDFAAMAGGKRLVTTIPIRKPNRYEWFRVHEDSECRIPLWTILDERDIYVVANALASDLIGDAVPKMLYPAITRQGVLFLWPVKLPGPDGKIDNWNASAAEAADRATRQWVRVAANMALGAYEIFEAVGTLADPTWPEMAFEEMVRIAVKGRVISDANHPVLRKLRGEL